jgi:predicted flap endonuclease-1-like 5' DNA nuclease
VLAVVVAIIAALAIGYAIGRARRHGGTNHDATDVPQPKMLEASPVDDTIVTIDDNEANGPDRRNAVGAHDAALTQLHQFAADRHALFAELATAREETARYRQLVIDLEDGASPPILGGPGMPDNLRLIVGIGPVLERMLHQLGIATYRQIARWTERDIDEMDAKLPEFPGRIRRDEWVVQARALHQSTYGEILPSRDTR